MQHVYKLTSINTCNMYIRRQPTGNQFTMSAVKDLFADFSERGLCPWINSCPTQSAANLTIIFGLNTPEDFRLLDDYKINGCSLFRPGTKEELKMIRNSLTSGKVIFPELLNDEGAPVQRSTLAGHTHLWYCSRSLGMDALPGSDGCCGPNDGPQCWACEKYKPGVKEKPGAGACQKISELNRRLADADQILANTKRTSEEMRHNLNSVISEKNDEIKRLTQHNQWLEREKKTKIDHLNKCYDDLDKQYHLSMDRAVDREREYKTEIQTLKRQKKNPNAVLTDLCSGEVPGSLTDVEEASRQAKQLVLQLDDQVETMRAEKERREAAEKILAMKRSLAEDKAPDYLCCSITHQLMVDPVVDRNGNTFEREAIEKWIKQHGTCPNTREPLKIEDLKPNRSLLSAIEALVSAQVLP